MSQRDLHKKAGTRILILRDKIQKLENDTIKEEKRKEKFLFASRQKN